MKTKEIFFGADKIICKESGNTIEISIKLNGDSRERHIGIVDIDTRILHIRRKKNHLLEKANSYGFNYHIISEAKRFDKVCLSIGLVQYLIPNHVIISDGNFLWFKEQGFEKQIFLSVSIIENFKL